MTALLEGSKFHMGMKGGFSPVLVEQILLSWRYLPVPRTQTGGMGVFSYISHHIVRRVTGFAPVSNIYL
ncbi:MAG: hypothetical protein QGH65_19115 [SAR324 cluster bacterium]|nr:hypothetical protein [SAR324 cluster bacterium]